MSGYIKLHRKKLDWRWFKDPLTSHLFEYLLLRCVYKEKGYKELDLKPGQVALGRKQMAYESGLSEQQVRSSLKKLISTNEITTKSTNRYTLIQLNNWNQYQTDNQPTNQPTNQPKTQPVTTNKESKEVKKERTKELNTTEVVSAEPSSQKNSSEVSKTTPSQNTFDLVGIESDAPPSSDPPPQESYGNVEITSILNFLKKGLGLPDFAESQKQQRMYGKHMLSLGKRIAEETGSKEAAQEEFKRRFNSVIADKFHRKNCNKIAYLYKQLKSVPNSDSVLQRKRKKF